MAFHFQPQPDSSDDEQVDISTWQTGAKPGRRSPALPAPVAPMGGRERDDDEGEIDFSTWQKPTTMTSARATGSGAESAPVDDDDGEVQVVEGDVPDDVDDVTDNSDVVELTDTRDRSTSRKRKRQAESFVSTGFTSINNPARAVSAPSEDDLSTPAEQVTSRTRRSNKETNGSGQRKLVPIIPQVEIDDDEILDFTAGGDVVRRVKKEIKNRDGDLLYTVEFEDRHVEQVRSAALDLVCSFS